MSGVISMDHKTWLSPKESIVVNNYDYASL